MVLEVLVMAIREEEVKGIQIGKEEVKLSLFANDMMLYTENLKYATRKLLELINEFSKVAGYKINTQKYVAFLYTNNERSEREIKETISFINTSETIKYLGTNLPKDTKDLYSKNYKTVMRQSIPRQNDKKSGTLGRRQESGILKEEERTTLFSPLHSLVLVT